MLKKIKPVTPSLRHSFTFLKNLNKKPLIKKKICSITQKLGKSSISGHIISKHKEKGVKKKYRVIDFKRKETIKGIICSVEHDPYRSSFIMAVFDTINKKFFYTLASENISVGDAVESGPQSEIRSGNSTLVGCIPAGAMISNVSLTPNTIGKIARAAGTFCFVRGHKSGFSFLELRSNEIRLVPSNSQALIGRISNESHFLEQSGKAGRSRWLGKRPKVRGVAMNPIDHPNGGGEGKKSSFKKTPWGKSSKKGRIKNISYLILKKRYE